MKSIFKSVAFIIGLALMAFILIKFIWPVQSERVNSIEKKSPLSISVQHTKKLIENGTIELILDVRSQAEYEGPLGHLSNSLLIPVQEIVSQVDKLVKYKSKKIAVLCFVGTRSLTATKFLREQGFDAVNIEGGIDAWIEAGYPVEKGKWQNPTIQENSKNGIHFILAGDRQGEIDLCGCSPEASMGGYYRFGTFLKKINQRYDSTLLLDLGNNFPSNDIPQKIDLIQKALKIFQPAAILVGPNELIQGLKTLDSKLPYVISNSIEEELSHYQQITIQNQKFLIFGYLSPKLIYHNKLHPKPHWLQSANQNLFKKWKSQIAQFPSAETILLFRGSSEELTEINVSSIFDRIITGNQALDEDTQVLFMKIGKRKFPSVPIRGMGVRHGQWEKTKKTISFQTEWLDSRYKDDLEIKPLFDSYHEEVTDAMFKAVELKEKLKQETAFTEAKACKNCHKEIYQSWKKSKHAKAYSTLKNVGKAYDPTCLKCHTLGYNQKGFISKRFTPKLANVQCENCHGPGKEHLLDPSKVKLPLKPNTQLCEGCHQSYHSPNFQFKPYLSKVQHILPEKIQ